MKLILLFLEKNMKINKKKYFNFLFIFIYIFIF